MMKDIVAQLADAGTMGGLMRETPPPSGSDLAEVVALCRSVLFPGYFGESGVCPSALPFHLGVKVARVHELIYGMAGKEVADGFVAALPGIRATLLTDVEAAYNGDPAAESHEEIVLCYPAIKAITNYRLAHQLLLLGAPLIPRMITEMAHSETGIDIHPAAQIGHHFTIDHGTGVVIGATCVIGNNVKLYQGVTLGAKSFPLDEQGHPIKGIPRHPILEDDVVVYSNATILGRITLARGTVVGGNLWVTASTQPGEQLVQRVR